MVTTAGASGYDPARMSQANRDLINLQTLNDDLRSAYQESSVECQRKEEEISALRQEVSDLKMQSHAGQSEVRSQIYNLEIKLKKAEQQSKQDQRYKVELEARVNTY